MQTTSAKLLDVVALLKDKAEPLLLVGQVGTIVEELAPDVFEVEFCDGNGHTLGFAELRREEFLILRHDEEVTA